MKIDGLTLHLRYLNYPVAKLVTERLKVSDLSKKPIAINKISSFSIKGEGETIAAAEEFQFNLFHKKRSQ